MNWGGGSTKFNSSHLCLNTQHLALAGVAQWIECQPANQRVTSSIPSLEHMPPGPQWGGVGRHERGNHTWMCLSFPLSLKINK